MTIQSQKLFSLALMFLSGMKPADMAKKLGWAERTVKTHLRSEIFRAQLVEMRKEVQTDTIQAILKRIDEEGMESLEVLTRIRDGDFEDSKTAAQQRAAAQFLLGDMFMDRKVPRLTGGIKGESEGVKISIGADALQEMFHALAEFKGTSITVPFETVPTVTQAPSLPRKLGRAAERKIAPIVAEEAESFADELRQREQEDSAI